MSGTSSVYIHWWHSHLLTQSAWNQLSQSWSTGMLSGQPMASAQLATKHVLNTHLCPDGNQLHLWMVLTLRCLRTMPKVQVVNAAGHQQCMTGRDGAQNSAAFLISHSLHKTLSLYYPQCNQSSGCSAGYSVTLLSLKQPVKFPPLSLHPLTTDSSHITLLTSGSSICSLMQHSTCSQGL